MKNSHSGELTANLVDIEKRVVFYGRVVWQDGVITELESLGPERADAPLVQPGNSGSLHGSKQQATELVCTGT